MATARWNTDWSPHWLNWLYTPSKTVSFMIGRETFHRLPRGVRFVTPASELKIGPMATSFERNLSMLVAPELVMHSRSVGDWKPLPFPREPRVIVGVGDSPYVTYGGTGLYVLEREGPSAWRLTVNPDARLVGNSLQGSLSAPVAELEPNPQWFRLKLPAWNHARCRRGRTRGAHLVPRVNGGWVLAPGVYHIRRDRRAPTASRRRG